MNRIVYWLLFPAAAGPLSGDPVALEVQPGSSSTIRNRTELGVAESLNLFGGTLNAEISLNPESGQAVRFRFEEGDLLYSDGSSNYLPDALPQTEDLSFTGNGLAATPGTVPGEGEVGAVTGLLRNNDHTLTLSRGILRTQYRQLIFGTWITLVEDTRDFSLTPQSGPVTGTSRVRATRTGTGVLLDLYRVELVHQADETPQTLTEPSTGFTVTTTTTGGFTAVGTTVAPSAEFHAWMVASGAVAPFSLSDRIGEVPGSILFALGREPGETDFPLVPDPAAGVVRLTLPTAGSRFPFRVEHSAGLTTWLPLARGDGTLVVPAGTAGPVEFALPAGSAGFVRLALEDGGS